MTEALQPLASSCEPPGVLQPPGDPIVGDRQRLPRPVIRPLAQQERPPHATSYAMAPASDGGINEMRSCNRHCRISWGNPRNQSNRTRCVKYVLPVLAF